jgi:outer membrane protein assembly factor BamB
LASCTPACDGERVFVNFLNGGSVWATALTIEGEKIWQERLTEFATHQGFGSSPAIYESLVIFSADNQGKGVVIALDRATGKKVWHVDRPKLHNYTSPMIHHVAGKDQLVMVGCDLVSSYKPSTGEKIWETKGATTECVTSTVTDGSRIFTSGGYPRNHLEAVEADGSGKVAWSNNSRVYVPSLLIREGYLYGVLDAGVACCWKSDSGKEQWKHRLSGTFSSSPVMVGDVIHATNEEAVTFVFKATPESFEKLAENKLGDEVFATPTICGNRIYTRVAVKEGEKRQEYLYSLGLPDGSP